MSNVVVDRKVDPSGRIESETHTATINFRKILGPKELEKVFELNGIENVQHIFTNTDPNSFAPIAYFTFKGKPEFYCVELVAMPSQKSLTESASETVIEKYNALHETLTNAAGAISVEDLKGKASDAFQWGKKFLSKK